MTAQEVEITNAQYVSQTISVTLDDVEKTTEVITGINCLFDGEEINAPIEESNRHYAEIKRQVDNGTITIADAE